MNLSRKLWKKVVKKGKKVVIDFHLGEFPRNEEKVLISRRARRATEFLSRIVERTIRLKAP
jgi:hypothetical protein